MCDTCGSKLSPGGGGGGRSGGWVWWVIMKEKASHCSTDRPFLCLSRTPHPSTFPLLPPSPPGLLELPEPALGWQSAWKPAHVVPDKRHAVGVGKLSLCFIKCTEKNADYFNLFFLIEIIDWVTAFLPLNHFLRCPLFISNRKLGGLSRQTSICRGCFSARSPRPRRSPNFRTTKDRLSLVTAGTDPTPVACCSKETKKHKYGGHWFDSDTFAHHQQH